MGHVFSKVESFSVGRKSEQSLILEIAVKLPAALSIICAEQYMLQ